MTQTHSLYLKNKNFHETHPVNFINTQALLQGWQKLLDLPSLQSLASDITPSRHPKFQSLASKAKNLWNFFNEDRGNSDHKLKNKHYMDDASLLEGYLASFYIPNCERNFALFTKEESLYALENLLKNNHELSFLDFGSGPLSASVGFLCALEHIFQQNPELSLPTSIKIFAVERSEKIFLKGKALLLNAWLGQIPLHIEKCTSVEKLPQDVHVAACSNSLNEIPTKFRMTTLNNIVEKLVPQGCLLILEPGQEQHARALGYLRNEINNKYTAEEVSLLGPCTHRNTCPMALGASRSDWCWFKHAWNPPETQAVLDRLTGLDHHVLNYSYVLFCKKPQFQQKSHYARVVSDAMPLRPENHGALLYLKSNLLKGDAEYLDENSHEHILYKNILCTNDTQTLKGSISIEKPLSRGFIIRKEDDLEFIFAERQEGKENR